MPEKTVKTREELSAWMVSYMKGEITSYEYACRTVWCDCLPRNIIEVTSAVTRAGEGDDKICVNKEGWDFYRRWLAILQTDYEVSSHRLKSYKVSPWLGWLIIFLLAIGLGPLPLFYFICLWIVSGVIWFLTFMNAEKKTATAVKADKGYTDYVNFGPFLSQEDWLAHEHLIDKFNLPEYDTMQYEESWNMENTGLGLTGKAVILFLVVVFIPLISFFSVISQRVESSDSFMYFRVKK